MSSHAEWIITPSELKNCLKEVILVDVREPEEYSVSYIEGCKHFIPLGELSFRGPQELNPESDLIIYCAHGIRSLHGVMALQRLGFKKLRSLEGGIVSWEEENGSISTPR
jgi:rhodanese-related sulfurtransferase